MTFTVDTHHHMLPDFFWEVREGDDPVSGIAPRPWSRASALSFLDDAGIDGAVTSISTPGVRTDDDTAARLRRRCGTWGRAMPFLKSNRASKPGTSWRLRPGDQGSLAGRLSLLNCGASSSGRCGPIPFGW